MAGDVHTHVDTQDARSTSALSNPPVFLVGAARSGTTLLYKSLCLHPSTAYISNWVRRFPAAPQLAVLNRLPAAVPALRRKGWFRGDNAYVYGERRSIIERMTPAPVEGETLFARCGITKDPVEVPPPVDSSIVSLRRAFGSVARWSGGRILVNKRIANSWRIPLLVTAFPDARFVNLVRDGRAVASSLARVDWWEDGEIWWLGSTPREWSGSGGDPVELCARNWVMEVDATERGLQHVPADNILSITYEDLIAEPTTMLRDVAAFAGLEPEHPQWLERRRDMQFPNRNDGWRRHLTDDAITTTESIQRETLRRYGYTA